MGKHIDFDLLMETAKQYGDDYVNFVLTVGLRQDFVDYEKHVNSSPDGVKKAFKEYPHINHYVKPYEKGGYGVNRQGETFKIIKKYKSLHNECLYENEDGELINSKHSRVSRYLIKFIDSHEYQTIITEKQLTSIYIDMVIHCREFDLKYFNQLSRYMGGNDRQLSGFCESDNPYHPLTDKGHFLGYDKIHGIPKKTGYNRKYYKRFIMQEQILDFSQYLLSLNSHNIIHTTWQGKHVLLGDENNE